MTDSSRPVWPRRVPAFRIVGMTLSIVLGILFVRAWLVWSAGPLQRFYFPTYSRLSLFSGLSLPMPSHKGTGFRVVFFGQSLATDASLRNAPGAVSIRRVPASPETFRNWLQADIYDGKSLARVLEFPLVGFGICFGALVVAGARLDRKYDAKTREGRLLRGPSLTSRWHFNRLTNGNGLRFRLTNRRNLFEWLKPGDSGMDLVIKRDREAHHVQIAGDTGSGKSTLVRQIVHQIAARNEVAIIFDPDREYIREFFRKDRGDWVLNPKDDRCPFGP